MLAHVVHAEDRRAALVGRDGGGERWPRAEPVVASGSPRTRPSELLRERPTSTGRPSASSTSSLRTSSKFCSSVLPKPIPGSRLHALLGNALRHGGAQSLLQERLDLGDDVVVARVFLHRARLALHVHQAEVGARLGDDPASSGSPRSAVTSLTISAPSASARRATSAFAVSIETGTPRAARARARPAQLLVQGDGPRSRAASTRRRRRRARAFVLRAACRAESAMVGCRGDDPPSEKLSGVTLTIPITGGAAANVPPAGSRLIGAMDANARRRGGPLLLADARRGGARSSGASRGSSPATRRASRATRGDATSGPALPLEGRASRVSLFVVLLVDRSSR